MLRLQPDELPRSEKTPSHYFCLLQSNSDSFSSLFHHRTSTQGWPIRSLHQPEPRSKRRYKWNNSCHSPQPVTTYRLYNTHTPVHVMSHNRQSYIPLAEIRRGCHKMFLQSRDMAKQHNWIETSYIDGYIADLGQAQGTELIEDIDQCSLAQCLIAKLEVQKNNSGSASGSGNFIYPGQFSLTAPSSINKNTTNTNIILAKQQRIPLAIRNSVSKSGEQMVSQHQYLVYKYT